MNQLLNQQTFALLTEAELDWMSLSELSSNSIKIDHLSL